MKPLGYPKLYDQDYKQILLHCFATGKPFEDDKFPLVDRSLFHTNRPTVHGEIEWKRVKDICKNPHLFCYENGQAFPEVVQGLVGNCWLVTALGVLAAHKALLYKVIPKWQLQDWIHSEEPTKILGKTVHLDLDRHPGIFRFRFYRFGQWIEVVIDDYLPTVDGHLIFSHGRNPNEMWGPLLEKAYAKLCGCYEALDAGSAADALVDLTGTIPETIDLEKDENGLTYGMTEENLINYLKETSGMDSLMSCSITVGAGYAGEHRLKNGLVLGHAYGILSIQELKHNWRGKENLTLMQLHNPWGRVEWNGPWSDESSEWTNLNESQRKKLNLKVADDGSFYMSFEDFFENFSTLTVCTSLNVNWYARGPRWYHTTFRGEWSVKSNTAGGCINNTETFHQNPQYAFTVTQPDAKIVVALMQKDIRDKRLEGAENHTIGFVCFRVEENRTFRLHKLTYDKVGHVTYSNAREVTARLTLGPGRYILIPSTFDAGKETTFLLRLFSSTQLNAVYLTNDTPKSKWSMPLLASDNLQYVGTVRLKIMDATFSRGITRGLIKVSYTDSRSKLSQNMVDVTVDDSEKPTINREYIFYVCDSSTAKATIKLYESNSSLGDAEMDLSKFAEPDREGNMFEVSKSLKKLADTGTSATATNSPSLSRRGTFTFRKRDPETQTQDIDAKLRIRITYTNGTLC